MPLRLLLAALAACTLLCSCVKATDTKELTTNFTVVPEGLEDCKVFLWRSDSMDSLNVVRCPNSTTSTTYRVGKHSVTTVVIDGVTYTATPAASAAKPEGNCK